MTIDYKTTERLVSLSRVLAVPRSRFLFYKRGFKYETVFTSRTRAAGNEASFS